MSAETDLIKLYSQRILALAAAIPERHAQQSIACFSHAASVALVAALALSSSYCPTAHATHPLALKEPAVECLPAAQSTHSVAALLSSSFFPATHCVHDVDRTSE